jgi:hypothetical protein
MGKFDKYFIQNTKGNPLHVKYLEGMEPSYTDWPIWIDSEAENSTGGVVPGIHHWGPHLVMKTLTAVKLRPHAHDFDEYLLFHGTDPAHPEELGGEVEFWLEGEKHVFTKSTAVFIPAFWYHTPMAFPRVDRPFWFETRGNTLRYSHVAYDPDPKCANDFILDEVAEVKFGDKTYQVVRSYLEYLEWMKERARKNIPK